MFFYGNKLYSYGYHYLLAEFLDADNIYIDNRGYSSTTSKHISIVSYGTRQYKQWFSKQCDIGLVYGNVIQNSQSLATARKPHIYIDSIMYLWESLNQFLEYNRGAVGLTKKNYQPYFDVRYLEMKAIVKSLSSNTEITIAKLKEARAKADKKKKADDKKRLATALKKFNDYKINTFRIGDEDYLRISQDGDYVQTSQGVDVSMSGAKMLYALIKQGIDIRGRHIDSYTVTSINGVLTIGCHRINMASVKQIGELIIDTQN